MSSRAATSPSSVGRERVGELAQRLGVASDGDDALAAGEQRGAGGASGGPGRAGHDDDALTRPDGIRAHADAAVMPAVDSMTPFIFLERAS